MLLELEQPLKWQTTVKSACLNTEAVSTNDSCVTAGWGVNPEDGKKIRNK